MLFLGPAVVERELVTVGRLSQQHLDARVKRRIANVGKYRRRGATLLRAVVHVDVVPRRRAQRPGHSPGTAHDGAARGDAGPTRSGEFFALMCAIFSSLPDGWARGNPRRTG